MPIPGINVVITGQTAIHHVSVCGVLYRNKMGYLELALRYDTAVMEPRTDGAFVQMIQPRPKRLEGLPGLTTIAHGSLSSMDEGPHLIIKTGLEVPEVGLASWIAQNSHSVHTTLRIKGFDTMTQMSVQIQDQALAPGNQECAA